MPESGFNYDVECELESPLGTCLLLIIRRVSILGVRN